MKTDELMKKIAAALERKAEAQSNADAIQDLQEKYKTLKQDLRTLRVNKDTHKHFRKGFFHSLFISTQISHNHNN